jgi:hypothetical protein
VGSGSLLCACRFVILHDSSYHPTTVSPFSFGHVEASRDDENNIGYCNDYREELRSFHEFSAVDSRTGLALPDTLVGSMTRDVGAVIARLGLVAESMFRIEEEM